MLEFSASFFEPEIREDFLIDGVMKTVWAAELEVLQDIAIICNRHNLKWYAAYGTLLGAVRHGGFVPWDDDIDIWMLRDDYMKLLEIMPDELPKGYYVQSCLNENGCKEYSSFVANSYGINIDPEHLKKFHNCPFIMGVDIFPLDYLPRDKKQRMAQKNLFYLTREVTLLLKDAENIPDNREHIVEALKALEAFYQCKFDEKQIDEKPVALISFLWKKANQLAMAYGKKDGDELTMYLNYAKYDRMVYPKRWFQEVEYLDFEEVMLPVPKEYDAVLRATYGDYTLRRKNTSTHDYPNYKSQLKFLEKTIQEMEENVKNLESGQKTSEDT